MTPEEKFDQEIWNILQKIKINILRTKKNGFFIKYKFPIEPAKHEREKIILEKLEEREVVKIIKPERIPEYFHKFSINNPLTTLTLKDLDPAEYLKFIGSADIVFLVILPKFNGFYKEKERKFLTDNADGQKESIEKIQEEKKIIENCREGLQHKKLYDQWKNRTKILEMISEQLLPVGAFTKQQPLYFKFKKLPVELKESITFVMQDLVKASILEYIGKTSQAISTARPAIDINMGQNITIKDRYEFETYKREVYKLIDFTLDDGKKRFPKYYQEEGNTKLIEKIKKKENKHIVNSTPNIQYNKETGIGYVNNKKGRFKFKNDQPDFFVFSELYKNINKSVIKKRVLELSKYDGGIKIDNSITKLNKNQKRKSSNTTSETYFINNLAKKMRKRTKLNVDHIVNNNGDLTLVGYKLKSPPN